MSPRTRVRLTFQSTSDGASIIWDGEPIGSTQETFALLATDIDNVDVTLPGWLPCHAADAGVPGWRIVDQMQTLLVTCPLRKKDT